MILDFVVFPITASNLQEGDQSLVCAPLDPLILPLAPFMTTKVGTARVRTLSLIAEVSR